MLLAMGAGSPLRAGFHAAASPSFVLDLRLGIWIGAAQGTNYSPIFAIDLTQGYPNLVMPAQAQSLGNIFAVDLRGIWGPSGIFNIGYSPVFAINLRGSAGGLSVSGKVKDGITGSALSGALVQVGSLSATTDASGNYSIGNVAQGTFTLRATKTGYQAHEGQVVVQSGAAVVRDLQLLAVGDPKLRVTRVATKYGGFLHFLDDAHQAVVLPPQDFKVTFLANIDWGGHPSGTVRFVTPKKTYTVATSSSVASQEINMTDDFDWKDRLRVVAVSGDGTQSLPMIADFVVMRPPLPTMQEFMGVSDRGGAFEYNSSIGFETTFISDGLASDAIPESFPLFGGKPLRLDWLPSVGATIGSDGHAELSLKWDNIEAWKKLDESWGRDQNAKKISALLQDLDARGKVDRRRLPKAGVAGAEIYFYPVYKHYLQHNDTDYSWDWTGSSLGLAGYGKVRKSWPFILMAGPIPIPTYVKAMVELEATAMGTVNSLDPFMGNLEIELAPYARGSVGVGVDAVLSIEGWVGGGGEITFRYPQSPHVVNPTFYLNGGVKVYALLWSWENELMRWDWPEPQGAAAMSMGPAGVADLGGGRAFRRDYLNATNYGRFVGAETPEPGLLSLQPPRPGLHALAEPIQLQVFPWSEPELAGKGTNVLLAWLYDAPERSTNNRTRAMSSWYGGTTWTTPAAIEDDGTADFHPQTLVFGEKSGAAVWEDGAVALSDSAVFDTIKTNLEISVAFHNPASNRWLASQRMTTNSFLDRSPKLAGVAATNLLLTWIANTNGHLLGDSTNRNAIMFSRWNGTNWSAATRIATVTNPIPHYDLAGDGTNAWMVLSLDMDQDVSTVADRELFRCVYNGTEWGGLERLTDDGAGDVNPQLAVDPVGLPVLVWLKTNEVVGAVNFDLARRQVLRVEPEYSSNIGGFRLGSSPDGRMAVVWADPSDYTSDLKAMFYDPVFQAWGAPKQLTTDPETERNTAVTFYGSNTLMAVYNRTTVGITNGSGGASAPVFGGTDLYALTYRLGSDLCLQAESLRSTPPNPEPGSMAEMEFGVVNQGDGVVSNAIVAFYLGSPASGGIEVGRTNVLGPILPGQSILGRFLWSVPSTNQAVSLFAVIDPDATLEDADRLNNSDTGTFVAPDLAVQSLTWTRVAKTKLSVTARVANLGVVASDPTAVRFSLGGVAGTVVYTGAAGAMEPGQSMDIAFEWDAAGLEADTELWAVVDPLEQVADFNRDNNRTAHSLSKIMLTGKPVLGPIDVQPLGRSGFDIMAEIGRDYAVEASTNLLDWTSIGAFTATNALTPFVDPSATNEPIRFYRAVQP